MTRRPRREVWPACGVFGPRREAPARCLPGRACSKAAGASRGGKAERCVGGRVDRRSVSTGREEARRSLTVSSGVSFERLRPIVRGDVLRREPTRAVQLRLSCAEEMTGAVLQVGKPMRVSGAKWLATAAVRNGLASGERPRGRTGSQPVTAWGQRPAETTGTATRRGESSGGCLHR